MHSPGADLVSIGWAVSTKTVTLLNQINWEVTDNNDCETLNEECQTFTFDISKFLSGLFLLLNSVAPALPGLVLL